MTKLITRVMGSSLFIACIFVVLAAVLPLALRPSAEFLGKDVSALAAGIVSFYPWAAVSEFAKVLSLAVSGTFLACVIYRTLSRYVKSRWWRWLVFPAAPLLAYVLWLFASVIRYPALYESSLPEKARHVVYAKAQMISPLALTITAIVMLAAPFIWGMLTLGRRRALGLFLIIAGLGSAVGIYRSWPYWGLFRSTVNAEDAAAPHVLFIGVDSLRYDRLGNAAVTPRLQELLNDPATVSFDDHVVGVPRTFPSWVEILQGKNAPETGVRHMFPGFKARMHEFVGLVTAFRAANYDTQVISDFAGDIFPRFRAGFNKIDAPNLTLATMIRMNVDQMLPLLLPMITSDLFTELFPSLKESPAFADPKQLTDKAMRALVRRDLKRPLFLTLFYSTAHFPYAAPYPYYQKFSEPDYRGPFLFQKNPDLKVSASVDSGDAAQTRALYDGAVNSVDAELGRLFDLLKRLGLWEQTIIVVTADHGEDLYEPGFLQGHGEHLRGDNVLHTPWLLKLANQSPATKRLTITSRSIDIAETLAGAAKIPQHVAGAGENLMPWVLGERRDDPGLAAYSETGIWFSRTGDGFYQKKRLDYPGISGLLNFDQGFSGEVVLNPVFEKMLIGSRHRSLIAGDYKLVYMPTPMGVEYQLFNRRLDPANEKDLSASQPEVFTTLKSQLHELVRKMEMKEGQSLSYDDYVVTE